MRPKMRFLLSWVTIFLLIGQLDAGPRRGGGGFGRSSSRSSGSSGRSSSRSQPSRTNSGSSLRSNTGGGGNYPRQQYTNTGGSRGGIGGSRGGTGGSKTPIGGGGFQHPKGQYPNILVVEVGPNSEAKSVLGSPGLYSKMDDVLQHEVPVYRYRDQSDRYLFLTSTDQWIFGPDYTKDDGWVLSSKRGRELIPLDEWMISSDLGSSVNKDAWWALAPDIRVSAPVFPNIVATFLNVNTSQEIYSDLVDLNNPYTDIQNYLKTDIVHNGLPVWRHQDGGNYFFFMTDSNLWMFGPDYTSQQGWIISSYPSINIAKKGWKVASDLGSSSNVGAWWMVDPDAWVQGSDLPIPNLPKPPSITGYNQSLSDETGSSLIYHNNRYSDRNPIPSFNISMSGNVTSFERELATLNCRVNNIRSNLVSWIRLSDYNHLSLGGYTKTSDSRFNAYSDSIDYKLDLADAQLSDTGFYECQISTTPRISHVVHLQVNVEPHGPPAQPGPRGILGLPGAPGANGHPGLDGIDGPKGFQGDPGLPGSCGPRGPPGPPGFPGLNGLPGLKGEIGLSGVFGRVGRKGHQGVPGEKGHYVGPYMKGQWGLPGPYGGQGRPGMPGLPGRIGRPGMPGEKGNKGVPGLPGLPGESGYYGAIGPPGPKGIRGTDGAMGGPGFMGNDGLNGAPGMDGLVGEPGESGHQGVVARNGHPGLPGFKGVMGFPGRPGRRGVRGQKGEHGVPGICIESGQEGSGEGQEGQMGPPGPPGNKGQQGEPGLRGMEGAMGLPGPPGLPGMKGEKGSSGVPISIPAPQKDGILDCVDSDADNDGVNDEDDPDDDNDGTPDEEDDDDDNDGIRDTEDDGDYVSCGFGFTAPSCAECPGDYNYNHNGENYCNGDCQWYPSLGCVGKLKCDQVNQYYREYYEEEAETGTEENNCSYTDKNDNCPYLGASGYCTHSFYSAYMDQHCEKSCKCTSP